MKTYLQISLLVLLAGVLFAASGCQQLEARDQLNRGVTNYKAAQFNQAIENFQKAIQLDPSLINAKLYLATAYQSQFVPGAPSDDNMKLAQEAMDEYKVVLAQDGKNANAIAGLARLNYDMGNLDDAAGFYKQLLSVQPSDPTAYYTLGAIAFQKTHKGLLAARQSLGITDINAPLVPEKKATANARKMCDNLKQEDSDTINDGIDQLNKALQLNPTYADAMTYLNLLYRDRADLSCGNETARQADLKIANDFVERGLAERKAEVAKANAKNSGGVVIDGSGTPK
ncbi:MAG: tetratricopeptide repeat protein [Terriglobales bacterium]